MTNTLTDEDKTFNRLKRAPFEAIEKYLAEIPKYPPIFMLGDNTYQSRKSDLVYHYRQLEVLKKHGWDFTEYVLEVEKRNVLDAIDLFNKDHQFPLELVERAKEFFPNAKFTQAKIELE